MKNTAHTEDAKNGGAAPDEAEGVKGPDPTIDQVRDLLFGGAQRTLESRLDDLREEMRSTVKQMQADFAKQIEAMQTRLSEMEQETEDKRLEAQREIGAAISDLGTTISALGSGRTRR